MSNTNEAKSKKPKPTRRVLGRGLAALIPESDFDILTTIARGDINPEPIVQESTATDKDLEQNSESESEPVLIETAEITQNTGKAQDVRYIDTASIKANPFQPRQIFSEAELEDLANSISEHGILQPVLVRPHLDNTGGYQLIAGERRWRAAQRAGFSQIPAIIREVDDKSALELAIIENVQRHDISAVESAHAYRRLSKEFGLSQEQVAVRVGKSRVSVANTMRLLDLPTEALDAIQKGQISEGHGRAILTAQGDSARRTLLRRILRDGLTVRDVERMAREGVEDADPTLRLERPQNADLARLETKLQRALGLRLKLKERGRGGQMVIHFNSPEELLRLTRKLVASQETD
jgi:ParB family chromosome partitioning protein